MSVLGDIALYAIRVYVLLPPEQENLRADIEAEVQEDPLLGWK